MAGKCHTNANMNLILLWMPYRKTQFRDFFNPQTSSEKRYSRKINYYVRLLLFLIQICGFRKAKSITELGCCCSWFKFVASGRHEAAQCSVADRSFRTHKTILLFVHTRQHYCFYIRYRKQEKIWSLNFVFVKARICSEVLNFLLFL